MTVKPSPTARNWFETGGSNYVNFRPQYPATLARFLASVCDSHAYAVDVGCGNGQLTHLLSQHFNQVIGADPSADQIAHAIKHQNIGYICSSAEVLPIQANCADLITAAQAAHWFELPRFYDEVRRIGKPNAVVALISYGVMQLDDPLQRRFDTFYGQEIGPYWPAERKLVDSGYADLPFPFEPVPYPGMSIDKMWTLPELLGYISTWSATKRALEAGQEKILKKFASDLTELWGQRETQRPVSWPISMRLGRL